MKGYTNFMAGSLWPEYIATKPIGKEKYMDWNRVKEIVNEHPSSVIYAGLREDWNHTSGLIFAKGEYYNGYVYGCSTWATPIVDVDGEEIECWVDQEPDNFTTGVPTWWGDGKKLLNVWDFKDENW